jgi:hypothetical protein
MEINRNNYQAWFLDYRENTLDAKQQKVLATFLQNHPDLQDEFLDFNEDRLLTLTADDTLVFLPKQKLKKLEIVPFGNIGQDNYDDFIIAHLEHDLDENQQSEFASFIALNPSIENEIALYRRTFLDVGDRLIYPAKLQIKKSVTLVPPRRYLVVALSIAALLVLVLMITNSLVRQSTETPPNLVNQEIVLQPLPPQGIPEVHSDNLVNKASNKTDVAFAKSKDTRVSKYVDNSNKPTLKTNSALPTRENLPPPVTIEARQQLDLEPQLATNETIGYRTEVSDTFRYMLLRDSRTAQPEPAKGTLARIVGNLTGKLIGNSGEQQEEPLLTTLTQNSRQLLMDLKEDMPLLDAATQTDPRDNYFALSENFSIRIRKAPKNEP